MTIDNIRKEAAEWTDLNPCKLYQGHVANEQAAMVKRLLATVDILAAKVETGKSKHHTAPTHLVEYWAKWADEGGDDATT
jgi:sporulation-control protein spo0M